MRFLKALALTALVIVIMGCMFLFCYFLSTIPLVCAFVIIGVIAIIGTFCAFFFGDS